MLVSNRTVREFTSTDYTPVSSSGTLAQARDALLDDGRSEAYVVNESGAYLGAISLNRLTALAASGDALADSCANYARAGGLVLSPDDSIWTAMSKMEDFVGESIPVVEDGRLTGVVFEAAIVKAYLETLNEIRREENAAA